MDKFLLVYYGGKMETDPKKIEKSMAVWMGWFKDLGKAVIDQGAPTNPMGKVVSAGGVKSAGAAPVTGYTLLQADNLDSAVAMAKNCPIIASGGQVAVYQLMSM